jgi:hypothetical protein
MLFVMVMLQFIALPVAANVSGSLFFVILEFFICHLSLEPCLFASTHHYTAIILGKKITVHTSNSPRQVGRVNRRLRGKYLGGCCILAMQYPFC